MRYLLLAPFLLAVALTVGAVPAPVEKKAAADNLDGAWVCTAVDGINVPVGSLVGKLKFTFAGKKMTLDLPMMKREATATFDFTKKPGWIDFTFETDPDKGKVGLGLFLRDGETLKICLDNQPDAPRPTEFKAAGSIAVVTLKLQK